jgi:hypothetical protein
MRVAWELEYTKKRRIIVSLALCALHGKVAEEFAHLFRGPFDYVLTHSAQGDSLQKHAPIRGDSLNNPHLIK